MRGRAPGTTPPDGARPAAIATWLAVVYFLSGACSLIDEVVWVRLLKLTLGNTVQATSVVVSVFLGGLALGAALMGRRADRVRNRLRLYAVLEAAITLTALAVPFALRAVDRLYVVVYRGLEPSGAVLLAIQVATSAVTILVPSLLMGSTLPLLGRFVAERGAEAGHKVGRLYALNTLGAAVGCFLAGFVLIREVGVLGTLLVAAGLNTVVALSGFVLSRAGSERAESTEPAPAEEVRPAATPGRTGAFVALAAAFFASGLVSVGFEVAWVRTVIFILGGDTYVFSAVLTTYLLGNVAGAALGSRIAPRLRSPERGFALTLLLLAATGALYMPLLAAWVSWGLPVLEAWATESGPRWLSVSRTPVAPMLHALMLYLVPSAIMGAGFPIALQAWALRAGRVGRSTGAAYAANTFGAVTGGALTGFVLVPLLGIQLAVATLGAVAALAAAALSLAAGPRRAGGSDRRGRLALPAAAAVVLAVGPLLPSGLLATVVDASPWTPDWLELIHVREGTTTTVSVHRNPETRELRLYSSGQSIAGDSFALRGDQKALGHFGMLLHGEVRDVLSVGFGSGETTRCMAMHDPESIDCVEIAPEVVETSLDFFPHLNLGDRLHDHVRMIYMDAKNWLHLTDRRYDLIVNDSIHPKDFSENASLYGQEYYASARDRLRPGGLFVSWLPTYHLSPPLFDSILGTALDVFPHLTLWFPTTNPAPLVLLVGSSDPQRFDPVAIDRALADPDVRDSLELIRIRSSHDLLNAWVGDENDLRRTIRDHRVNSDDTPFVEFDTDPWTPPPEMFRRYVLDMRSPSLFDHLDLGGMDADRAAEWRAQLVRELAAGNALLRVHATPNPLEQLRILTEALAVSPGHAATTEMRHDVDGNLVERGLRVLEADGPARASELADLALAIWPESRAGWIVRARAAHAAGDPTGAADAARRAVAVAPGDDRAAETLRLVLAPR